MHYSMVLALAAVAVQASPTLMRRQDTCSVKSSYPTVSEPKLNDPFTFSDGKKVTTKADWACRQKEISAMMQQYELGVKPPKPSTFSATFSGGTLTITAGEGGKTISFSVKINKPASGSGPYGAIIGVNGANIPVPNTLVNINFNAQELAQQTDTKSRGKGKFYDLYGSSHSAGALTAWAWGASRIIDALEATTGHDIDTKRIGVTGCSRNGKGAFVVGALEERFALVIPQESGAGGAACWRVSDKEKASGKNIQTASQIITENVWFGPAFNSRVNQISTLPFDHHLLAGLVAPRGLIAFENNIDWLGPGSTTACMKAGRQIYKAAGVPNNMGFSLVGGHNHCQFPSASQADLTAYINRFLLQGTAEPPSVEKSTANPNMADWVSWTVPTLS